MSKMLLGRQEFKNLPYTQKNPPNSRRHVNFVFTRKKTNQWIRYMSVRLLLFYTRNNKLIDP